MVSACVIVLLATCLIRSSSAFICVHLRLILFDHDHRHRVGYGGAEAGEEAYEEFDCFGILSIQSERVSAVRLFPQCVVSVRAAGDGDVTVGASADRDHADASAADGD